MPMATDLQQTMAKFTKLLGRRLYNIDVEVMFDEFQFDGFRFHGGECNLNIEQPLIKFNSALFKKDELNDMAWYLMIHEISHLKEKNHKGSFWKQLEDNLEKTMDLRKQFCEEAGLDEDDYSDFDYNIYFDDAPPEDAEIDEECLEFEDSFFETYNIFKDDLEPNDVNN